MGPRFSIVDNGNLLIPINAPREICPNISSGYCSRRGIFEVKIF